ncbi:hypothetical protein AB5J62_36620 [Amycolatopsis sp. cg5]|uniref:hypothetical protein n=1 Tax=Amycolatopsis sp. cg5 TaxID=3238802 RepID=UPI003525A011
MKTTKKAAMLGVAAAMVSVFGGFTPAGADVSIQGSAGLYDNIDWNPDQGQLGISGAANQCVDIPAHFRNRTSSFVISGGRELILYDNPGCSVGIGRWDRSQLNLNVQGAGDRAESFRFL